jgi:hypothetical protein
MAVLFDRLIVGQPANPNRCDLPLAITLYPPFAAGFASGYFVRRGDGTASLEGLSSDDFEKSEADH